MIFLSHTNADKPVVEPVAVALRAIFAPDQVFYDAWSIQPGEGIIDKMNEGLRSPEFVFFFVSERSLQSAMVNMEWQNALFRATQGKTRLIPVRVDGEPMPPILTQTVYVDMFNIGVDAAVRQIVNIVQGNTAFTPQHEKFENLTWSTSGDPRSKVLVRISASHVSEPHPSFGFVLNNKLGEVNLWIEGAPGVQSMQPAEAPMPNGDGTRLILSAAPIVGGPVTRARPIVYSLTPQGGAAVRLEAVMHEKTPGSFAAIPRAEA